MGWLATVERTVNGLDYELVDVERSAGGLLRVTIDRRPGQVYATGAGDAVTVDDCEVVTRQLQHLLQVEGIEYARLEVSSPGLDRPLKKLADWQRFAGSEIELTLREPFQNRRRWRGRLVAGADDAPWRLVLAAPEQASARRGAAVVAAPEQTLDFALDEVREARLVPAIDFKGRRRQSAAAAADGGQE